MSTPVHSAEQGFAREFKTILNEKGMSFSWLVGDEGEPTYFYVNGKPAAWKAFLENQVEAALKANEPSWRRPAAATDMLAALEDLVHSVLPADRIVAYANARAAIAKAKGEPVPTTEVLA